MTTVKDVRPLLLEFYNQLSPGKYEIQAIVQCFESLADLAEAYEEEHTPKPVVVGDNVVEFKRPIRPPEKV